MSDSPFENGPEITIVASPSEKKTLNEMLSGMDFVQVAMAGRKPCQYDAHFLGIDEQSGKSVHVKVQDKSHAGGPDYAKNRVFAIVGVISKFPATVRAKMSFIFRSADLKNRRRYFLVPHGKIVAFLGGDGSGKTSNIKEFSDWFGRYFQVRVIHIGKPPKGPLWFGTLVLLRIRKILLRIRSDHFHESVKHLLIARYRHKAFKRAVVLRSKGYLVCLDRFPLPGMTYMEAPQIRRLSGGGGIFEYLARKEEDYHAGIRGADEMFVLILDPSLAGKRRPEDHPVELKKRYGDILEREWPDGYAHLIDASQPFEKVVGEIRSMAWKGLKKTVKVFEIIGPAGSGKTSAARALVAGSNDLKTSVSWHDHKISLVKIGMLNIFQLFSLFNYGVNGKTIKEFVGLQIDLDILKKHKNYHILPCRNIVLEIGPVFKVSEILMEGKIQNPKIFSPIFRKIKDVIDQVVWMDAPIDILQQRINNRTKPHAIKNSSNEKVFDFIEKYRKIFSDVIGASGEELPVVRLDTSGLTVEEVARSIRQSL